MSELLLIVCYLHGVMLGIYVGVEGHSIYAGKKSDRRIPKPDPEEAE